MKKTFIFTLLLSISLIFFAPNTKAITQDSAPYKTYTEGSKGLVLTQTAYEPTGALTLETKMSDPEDILIKDNYLYIADTGNKRVIKTTLSGELKLEISDLNTPTGIDVDEEGNIYIADSGSRSVLKYDKEGTLIKIYERPKEPLFGETSPYQPIKVSVGPRGILYIVGSGSTNGLIQLNKQGEFIGFFGTNPVKKTFWGTIAELFGVKYAKKIPVSADNVTLDSKGSVYTVSKTATQSIKKFNIASNISLSLENERTLTDIKVNSFGNIYTITKEGIINEYDSQGNLIFQFGASDEGNNILGKFINPVSIDIDNSNNIYVLDKGNNSIQTLVKTDFANQIHEGIKNYHNGIYDIEEWRGVLKRNTFFSLANSAIANALYRDNQFDEALYYFKIAEDRAGYSEAFWQVRYNWLQAYLPIVFLIIAIYFITKKSLSYVDKRYQIYNPIRKVKSNIKQTRFFKEGKYIFKILRHPIDTVYEIKREKKSSVLTATIIYILFGILMLTQSYTTSFIFNYNDLSSLNALKNVVIVMIFIFLIIIGNYLISSLQSGEGWFKDVYITVAYTLSPVLLTFIPLILLSHALTLNEIFIYNTINVLAWSYSIILLIVVIKEVHNYTVKELIVNILLTIFTVLMIVLITFLIYLLTYQLFDYVAGLFKEVILRV